MFYAQVDPKWKNVKLGTCSDTIGKSGCFMTSLANLAWKMPVEVNDLFNKNGGFSSGCLINSNKAAELLNLTYAGSTAQKPAYVCIAETNYYAGQGVPQHFFLWNPDGRIADPLNMSPDWQQNTKKYPIVSYRLFQFKGKVVASATTTVNNTPVTTNNTSTANSSSTTAATTKPKPTSDNTAPQTGESMFAGIINKLKKFF